MKTKCLIENGVLCFAECEDCPLRQRPIAFFSEDNGKSWKFTTIQQVGDFLEHVVMGPYTKEERDKILGYSVIAKA